MAASDPALNYPQKAQEFVAYWWDLIHDLTEPLPFKYLHLLHQNPRFNNPAEWNQDAAKAVYNFYLECINYCRTSNKLVEAQTFYIILARWEQRGVPNPHAGTNIDIKDSDITALKNSITLYDRALQFTGPVSSIVKILSALTILKLTSLGHYDKVGVKPNGKTQNSYWNMLWIALGLSSDLPTHISTSLKLLSEAAKELQEYKFDSITLRTMYSTLDPEHSYSGIGKQQVLSNIEQLHEKLQKLVSHSRLLRASFEACIVGDQDLDSYIISQQVLDIKNPVVISQYGSDSKQTAGACRQDAAKPHAPDRAQSALVRP